MLGIGCRVSINGFPVEFRAAYRARYRVVLVLCIASSIKGQLFLTRKNTIRKMQTICIEEFGETSISVAEEGQGRPTTPTPNIVLCYSS